MKPSKNILVLLCSLLILSASCKKEKSANPIDDLPPATQTGANTFGCLVNGEAFMSKNYGFGKPVLECNVTFINNGYNFHLSSTIKPESGKLQNVNINTDSLNINQGDIIRLLTGFKGEASGAYYIGQITTSSEYRTNNQYTGKLNITKYDQIKHIVSGTFSFDAVNNKGEKVEIREGRFDMNF